ncbi:DUF3025 domain-containing protein [Ramlibacter alkalitolerans]|uniref:DUF3025 domain-containing protein n=1 Tax=Ramlibacter alkalitolerans TaxID=2039631 RepID=A0ABS1JHR1_9BURK|nr:DUF3025 domain-containing protein [Ramlibacter alkalitolerans]MBL0423748.1 DUF3025 domain-containing protein [Ramlibacter alkalitolerans]
MQVDWAAPWYAPWRRPGEVVAGALAGGAALHDALNAAGPAPVRFVPQEALPPATAYEAFIQASGTCPVRPGLHDFFNGLVWLAFPQAKAALNRLQAEEIARGRVVRRGPVRDAITVFDENGALLLAPAALWQALRERAWRRLFVDLRPLWAQARLVIFGHALLEQLAAPRKDLTAHVWCPGPALGPGADLDAWLAAQCRPDVLAAKPFTPLPVLGVPGWCAGSENFSFYDDSLVFRPRKTPEPITTTTSAGPARS